ncbi:MAG: DUF87 domain-containing protein [Deltaproteobacteria bacterium]|nr:DUF87 domain-containing protein [Deltaproteobacteria bacterium]
MSLNAQRLNTPSDSTAQTGSGDDQGGTCASFDPKEAYRPVSSPDLDLGPDSSQESSWDSSRNSSPVPPEVNAWSSSANESKIFLGFEKVSEKPYYLDPRDLLTNALIFAGHGSGKTVLIRRIVEEAALLKIPSIVIDMGNDLVSLGQKPASITPENLAKSQRYFAETDVRVYTPGSAKGRPILLSTWPEFVYSSESYSQYFSVDSGVEYLSNYLGLRGGARVEKELLKTGLIYLIESQFSELDNLISFLENPLAHGYFHFPHPNKSRKLAQELKAFLKNPFSSNDEFLAKDNSKTPISIFNLLGLTSLSSKQIFVNQLTQSYFNWGKKNPKRSLQGLLIIDGAEDFAPASKATPANKALIRFASQARKYGLGLILTTPDPKRIDSQIFNECATQFFGHFSSPMNIEAAEIFLRKKGVIQKLEAGQFFIRSLVSEAIELKVALGLSNHLPTPLSPQKLESLIISLSKNANSGELKD